MRLFGTSRAKRYHKGQRLLLDALTRSLPQKCIFQDSFSSMESAKSATRREFVTRVGAAATGASLFPDT